LKKQTGIQDFRLNRGASVGTDVLQAKNALAGATTARVAADGAYRIASSKFRSVFGDLPANVDALLPIQIPNLLIPKTEEEFKAAVMKNGDQLLRARTSYDMAMVNRDKSVASNFLPEFNFTAEMNYKGDAGGTLGGKNEAIAKVEMTWPIELFGTQMNTHRASMLSSKAAAVSYAQAKKGIEDGVSNGWIGYRLAKLNRANVQNQVKIAEQFLRLSQMEVKKGRGKMTLVVNAQSALINARKSLQGNTSDHAVQVYNILAQMGELSVAKLEDASVKESEMIKKSMDDYKKKVAEAQEKAKADADAKSKVDVPLTQDQMKDAWGKLNSKIKGATQ
jgi:adhesin transport system outer membrane protein